MPYVQTNGVETYYERRGDGQPVVFVHGLTMDRRTWHPQVAAFGSEYEVVTYDYRRHGETEAVDLSEVSVPLLVDDLRALIEELDLENPVLCGHSFGGLIIGEYAHQYPDEVAGLVFAEARTGAGGSWWESLYVRLLPTIQRVEGVVGEDRISRIGEFLVKNLENASRGANPVIDDLDMTVFEYIEEASEQITRIEKAEFMRAGLEYAGTSPTAFDVPVLFVYGEKGADLIGGKADQLRTSDVIVREIEDADHLVSLQQPDAFNDVLQEFLDEIRGGEARVGTSTHD